MPAPIQPDFRSYALPVSNRPLLEQLEQILPSAEALWNRIVHANKGPGLPRRIAVVAPHEQAGSTTVARGLALFLAQVVGRAVLLVECDLRSREAPTESLAPVGAVGLVGLLGQKAMLPEVVFRIEPAGIHLLPAGGVVATPSTLLSDEAFGGVLRAVSSFFDVVILECPALSGAPENRVLLPSADACVAVFRSGTVDPEQASLWLARIEEYGGRIGAVCLNGIVAGLPAPLRGAL